MTVYTHRNVWQWLLEGYTITVRSNLNSYTRMCNVFLGEDMAVLNLFRDEGAYYIGMHHLGEWKFWGELDRESLTPDLRTFVQDLDLKWAHIDDVRLDLLGSSAPIYGYDQQTPWRSFCFRVAEQLQVKSCTPYKGQVYKMEFEDFYFEASRTRSLVIGYQDSGKTEWSSEDYRKQASINRRIADKLELYERLRPSFQVSDS